MQAAQANIEAAQSEVTASEAAKRSVADQTRAAHAAVELARAAGKDAARKLSYVTIKAPADGRIGNKNVEVGNRVQTGQTLMVMVEPEIWVESNFKETQLAQIRVGQAAGVVVDAIPRTHLRGQGRELRPGDRRAIRAPARGQRHRQFHQGGAARAGARALYPRIAQG